MKILSITLRVLLILILLPSVIGATGIFPPPTPDMFTPEGWAFMSALMETAYMMPLIGILGFVTIAALLMGRTALAALLLAPFTVNVIAFHWFLDAFPIGASSVLAYVLLALNLYFLWENRSIYKSLWAAQGSRG